MSTYKAIVGKTDTSLYTSCQKDSDCAYVPSCSSSANTLIPVNKDYVAECSGAVLCNNKCRCGNQETTGYTGQNVVKLLQARCVNFQCISTHRVSHLPRPRQPVAVTPGDQRGTGSIQ